MKILAFAAQDVPPLGILNGCTTVVCSAVRAAANTSKFPGTRPAQYPRLYRAAAVPSRGSSLATSTIAAICKPNGTSAGGTFRTATGKLTIKGGTVTPSTSAQMRE